jgi:amino acid transporter
VLKVFGSVHKLSLPVDLPFPFIFRNATREPRHGFPTAKLITILAACLAIAILAFLALEAFDGDPDLAPFGMKCFTAKSPFQFVMSSQPISAFSALMSILCFMMTAGAYLVLRYRARSALVADLPSISIALNVAESWGPPRTGLPGSRPFLCGWQGQDWDVSG